MCSNDLDTYNLIRICRSKVYDTQPKRILATHTTPRSKKRKQIHHKDGMTRTSPNTMKLEQVSLPMNKDMTEGKLHTYAQCILRHKYGRPSRAYRFSSAVLFDHILLPLCKSAYMDPRELGNLLQTHPLYKHLFHVYNEALHTTFDSLKTPRLGFDSQSEIPTARIQLLRDLTVRFLGHIPSIIDT